MEKAVPLLKRAADLGNENAINFLGAYYFNISKEI
jgi:TPR repeat protein